MGLLKDYAFVESAAAAPALAEVIREDLIRALFVRDDRMLPRDVVAPLAKGPAITVKVKTEDDVRRLVRVANGQESTTTLGLGAADYHYVRLQLAIGKDRDIGISMKPSTLTTYDWIVPPQGGVLVDPVGLDGVEVDPAGHQAVVGVGAKWKALYDRAKELGRFVPFLPHVPLDYAMGDAVYGDAVFSGYAAPWVSYVYGIRSILPAGHRARAGFDEVPPLGTGYDIVELALATGAEWIIPVALAVRLSARPPVLRTLAYGFADPAKAAEAVDRLTRSGRSILWARVYDERSWPLAHPGPAPGAWVIEVGLGGTATSVAASEKAMDGVLAGSSGKAVVTPDFEAEAGAYSKAGEKVGRHLFVGEVVGQARQFGALYASVRTAAEKSGQRFGAFTTLSARGTASLSVFFEAVRDRPRAYELSRVVRSAVASVPGAWFHSRLSALWSMDPAYRKRLALLLRLKTIIDAPRVAEPVVTV